MNRAYYYLHSCYAPAYNPETAATDLSVPLLLKPDLEAVAIFDDFIKLSHRY